MYYNNNKTRRLRRTITFVNSNLASCMKRGMTVLRTSAGQQGPSFSTVSAIVPAAKDFSEVEPPGF